MKKISVVIAVYNAAESIAKTLDSLKWADEVIALDTASTDSTQEICRRYPNCKVIQDSRNDINLKRNRGYELAGGDWILNLDADEVVPSPLAQEIKEILALDNPEFDGYFCANREFIFGRWIYYAHGQKHRPQRYFLFRKGYMKWEGKRTHEMPVIKGRWGYLKNLFDHESSITISGFLDKINKYTATDMSKLTLEEARNRFSWRKMLFLPLKQFFIMYIKHQGFRDGAPGLILSVLSGINVFIEYAKLWEFLYIKNASAKATGCGYGTG